MIPEDLPEFGDKYLQCFNSFKQQFELRRKSTAEGNLSISESMDLISILLKKHQCSFVPNRTDKNLILFPYAILELKPNDKIINKSTKEVYVVDQIIKNPKTNSWEGLVKLKNVKVPPNIEKRESLEFQDHDRYINFDHEYPDALLNIISANPEGILENIPNIVPTITWKLTRVEPGAYGEPFGSRKELKSRLRESVKDPLIPGYTVEIRGQYFDNIIEFGAWSNTFRACERLINWIETFIKLYSGYLRKSGLEHVFFWRRNEDSQKSAWRQQLPSKTTQFYFRTEELEAVYQRDILKIDITLGTSDTYVPYSNKVTYVADQLLTGNYTAEDYRSCFYRSGEYLFGNIDILQ